MSGAPSALAIVLLLSEGVMAEPDGCSRALGPGSDLYDAEIQGAIASVAGIWPVPPSFVKAVIHRESGFRPRCLSPTGAVGLMQVMPGNARRLGVTPAQLWTPATNILAGTASWPSCFATTGATSSPPSWPTTRGPAERSHRCRENGETPGYLQGVLSRRGGWFGGVRPRRAPDEPAPPSLDSSAFPQAESFR